MPTKGHHHWCSHSVHRATCRTRHTVCRNLIQRTQCITYLRSCGVVVELRSALVTVPQSEGTCRQRSTSSQRLYLVGTCYWCCWHRCDDSFSHRCLLWLVGTPTSHTLLLTQGSGPFQ